MGHVLFLRKGSVHTAPGKVLPAGYTKLQYIQSTGTQWIDTGFAQNQNSRFVVDFQLVAAPTGSYAWIFEGRDSGPKNRHGVYATKSNGKWYGGYGATIKNTEIAYNLESRITVDFDKNILKIGQTPVTFSVETFQSTTTTALFACKTDGSVGNYSAVKLYSCQIYDNGNLIRDFVPCIDPSGAVGLYDLTGKQFYGNSGTGVFYAGPPVVTLPEGYTQLMYLESSGTQYINTGFTPNQDARIQLDCERTAANATDHFFGVRTGNSASSAFAFYIYNSGWRWAYNNATISGTGPDIGRYFIDANKNVTTINGDTTLTGTYGSFTAAAAAPLFAMLSAPSGISYGSFRLYSCRIYNNGLMVRDFIPCRNASGTIGLYDLVNGQFYTNAGTGTFTAGEVA